MLIFEKPRTRSNGRLYGRRSISDDKTIPVENNNKLQIGYGLKPTKRGSDEESSRSDESDDGSVCTPSLGSWRIPVIKQVHFDKDLLHAPSLDPPDINRVNSDEEKDETDEESDEDSVHTPPLLREMGNSRY